MKAPYILFLALTTLGANAQTSNNSKSLQRAVTIEKEFSPIVQDASKINSIPEMEVSSSERPDIKYAEWDTPRNENPQIGLLAAGNYGVEAPEHQRGYAQIEIGNYLNLNANAGVRIIDKENDRLAFWYRHNSTNGKLDYLQNDNETHQRRNDNRLNLAYTHEFDHWSWDINAHYRYNGFNYYGQPLAFGTTDVKGLPSTTDQQTTQQYGINTKIATRPNKTVNFLAEVEYRGYNSDLGFFYGERGVIENHLTTHFDINAPIGERYFIGIAAGMDNLIYNRCERNDYTQLHAKPYFGIKKGNITFKAGLLIDFSIHDNTFLRFAPDVTFDWEFDKYCLLYARLTGGKSINSWESMSRRTIYIDPTSAMSNTYTPADFTLGLRTTSLKKLHFTLFGGIKYSIDALFDYRRQFVDAIDATGRLTRAAVSFYATDAYAWKTGFEIGYIPCDYFKANLSWQHNEWHRTQGNKGRIRSAQPRNEWKAGILVTPTKRLDISADLYFADGMGYYNICEGSYDYLQTGNLPNIVTLNLGAIYRLNKQVHFSADLNNLLSKRTDLYYGMPGQRFHFLLGAGVVF